MSKQEEPVYLNVNPLCEDIQVIHVESTLGFNIMLLAKFECSKDSVSGVDIKVNKITLYNYPMIGIVQFGILDVIVEKELFHKYRIIRILLGVGSGDDEKEVDLTGKNIIWKSNDIVDNKISFEIDNNKYNRKTLEASNPILRHKFPLNTIKIPVEGRPCQFKLVSPMS